MKFKKLALAAAVAAAPMSVMALEPMQDEALSGVTGQDGISLSLATDVSANLRIHDLDGNGTGNSGAIVIDGFSITRNAGTDAIGITIDADDGGTSGAFLNIGVSLPSDLTINMGALNVADSGRSISGTGTAATRTGSWDVTNTVGTTATPLINLGSMTLGATTLNIQLGNEPQGSMIALNTSISNGINISGFAVNDADSGGGILADLQIVDNGSTATPTLTVNTGIDLVNDGGTGPDGLRIGLAGIGGASGMDVRMTGLSLDGGATTMGDVELVGLQLSGNLYVNGK